MKFDITTKPLSEEETNVILGVYDAAKAAYDAVQRDAWENARAEFRDLCNAVAEWAAPSVPDGVAEALQRLIENGAVLGPASSEDALLVARYRQRLLACAPSVPDGWQLVPTAESRHPGIYKMLGALHAADNTPGMSEWEGYRAMLAEAPEAKS